MRDVGAIHLWNAPPFPEPHDLRSSSVKRRRTGFSVGSIIAFASRSRLQRLRPSGGVEQTVATSSAVSVSENVWGSTRAGFFTQCKVKVDSYEVGVTTRGQGDAPEAVTCGMVRASTFPDVALAHLIAWRKWIIPAARRIIGRRIVPCGIAVIWADCRIIHRGTIGGTTRHACER
jgi:hypothetical protein